MIIIRTEEVTVDYEVRNRLELSYGGTPLVGPLGTVLEQAGKPRSHLVLIGFLIECIAAGWSTSSEELRDQDWHLDYKDDVLWADLRRP